MNPSSTISVPMIETDEPAVMIPAASVAPLDGASDGERLTAFIVTPDRSGASSDTSDAISADVLGAMRARVLRKPLTYVAAAFTVGLLFARARR